MSNRRSNRKENKGDVSSLDEGELSEDGRRIVQAITEQLNELKAEFRARLDEKDREIVSLKEDVAKLKNSLCKIEEKIDDADAYERRDTLVISGQGVPTAEVGENCQQIFCDLIKDKLHVNVGRSDISTAHRVGKKPVNQQPDKRNIIAKLCRRDLKMDILNACRQLKPNIYINESLTPLRSSIMYVLRMAKKRYPSKISGYNSKEGSVQVWLKPPNSSAPGARNIRKVINTRLALENFCNETLEVPRTTFVEEWRH